MELDELVEKCVHIEFKEGESLEGILIEIKDFEDYEDMIFYSTLTIRDYEEEYRVVYLNEIESIEEIK
mgnify:FL=1